MSISGFFWQAMIHSPASISIGNETDVTRDIVFRHCTGSRFLSRALLSTDLLTIASTDNNINNLVPLAICSPPLGPLIRPPPLGASRGGAPPPRLLLLPPRRLLM